MIIDSHDRRRLQYWPKYAGWIAVLPLLLVIWELGAGHFQQPWILPPATRVAARLLHPFEDHFASGSLAGNTLISIVRVMIGFLTAALVAVPAGLLMGSSRVVRGLLEPVVELLRPLCPIAWIPFAIAVFKLYTVPQLFGISFTGTILDQVQVGMVFVLFWGAFFPILINTVDGVSGVRRNYLLLARSLGAKPGQAFVYVNLPAAMPMVLTGLRQGIATAWFVIIAAEMLPGADSGIGYLLMYAGDQSAMDIVIAAMIIIAALAASLNAVIVWSSRGLVRCHGEEY